MKANNQTIYQALDAVDAEFDRWKVKLAQAYPMNQERYLHALEMREIECMDRKETLRKLLEVA